MSVIRQEAAMIAELLKRGPLPDGLRYSSPLDLVVSEGQEFSPVLGLERGPAKQCFRNAGNLAIDYPERYVYVEGFAVMACLPLPTAHAWVWDRVENRAVEVTWPEVGPEYLGVAFQTDWFRAWTFAREVWGVLDLRIMCSTEADPGKYAQLVGPGLFGKKVPSTPSFIGNDNL